MPKTNLSVINQSYAWKNVSIGGGGYISKVILHPQQPELIYLVTNVGGLFRWERDEQQAIPLTDKFQLRQGSYYSINGLALHPTDPNILFIAAGNFADKNARPGAIFKSTDQGKNWTQATPPDWPVKVGGMNYPWVVDRLVIDPNNPDVILYGSNVDGLWRSADAGQTWGRVTTIDGVSCVKSAAWADKSLTGIMAVVFDPHLQGRVYAGAYGDGVYQSDDSGENWIRISGSPQKVFQMSITVDGALWVTCKPGKQKYGVAKYEAGKWLTFRPSGKSTGYNALAVNPHQANEVMVATWWVKGPYSHENLYRTIDGGKQWTQVKWAVSHTQPWLPDGDFNLGIASIAFDPISSQKVWLTNGYSFCMTEDINQQPVQWSLLNKNIENTVVFDLAEMENGQLLSAIADISGFRHDNGLDAYPSSMLIDGDKGLAKAINTYSLARTKSSSPQKLVRVVSQFKGLFSGVMASTDQGATWSSIKKTIAIPFVGKGYPFHVTIAPSDPNNLVITRLGAIAQYTCNGGRSWHNAKGLPKGLDNPGAPFTIYARPLCADGAMDGTFYYYQSGIIYRSQDGGKSFDVANSSLPVKPPTGFYSLQSVAGRSNEIWLNLDAKGLFHSIDGGTTWSGNDQVISARLFTIGKAVSGSNIPTLYLYGTIEDGVDAIFSSTDNGASWMNIQDPDIPIGNNPVVMEASPLTFGLVYIGTAGRGIYYGYPSNKQVPLRDDRLETGILNPIPF